LCRPGAGSCQNVSQAAIERSPLIDCCATCRLKTLCEPGVVCISRAANEQITGKLSLAFGAFVDVGVHQHRLAHISAIPNAYVKDSCKIAKPGDIVRVKVLEVDPKHRRISLTMPLDQDPEARRTTARTEIDPTEPETGLRPGETCAGSSNPGSASGRPDSQGVSASWVDGNDPRAAIAQWVFRYLGRGGKTPAKDLFPDAAEKFSDHPI